MFLNLLVIQSLTINATVHISQSCVIYNLYAFVKRKCYFLVYKTAVLPYTFTHVWQHKPFVKCAISVQNVVHVLERYVYHMLKQVYK